jgi:hypothetical protein
MKSLRLLFVLFLVSMASCKLDDPYTVMTDVTIYVTNNNIPKTGLINQPVNISATGNAYNDCFSSLEINLLQGSNNFNYTLFASANYESHGTCGEILLTCDSIVSFTPKTVGNYIITTWTDPYHYEKDTVVVTEP